MYASRIFHKPHPKKESQFYSWGQVETFSLMRIKGGRSSRDFYQIEVYFFDKDLVKTKSLWNRLRCKFTSAKPAVDLIIPIYLLDVGLPKLCPTLSESGASNRIVNAIKNLKAKRRKDFIKRTIFLFSKKCVIIESKNFKRKKCYELKRLHCNH